MTYIDTRAPLERIRDALAWAHFSGRHIDSPEFAYAGDPRIPVDFYNADIQIEQGRLDELFPAPEPEEQALDLSTPTAAWLAKHDARLREKWEKEER